MIFIQMYSPKEFFNNKDRDSIPRHDSVGLSYKISREESFSLYSIITHVLWYIDLPEPAAADL